MRLRTTLLAAILSLGAANATADSYDSAVNSALDENYSAAFSYWMPLAKAGDPRAQFNIALMYHGGLHVGFDESAALEWYQRAAENGVTEAQEYLAVGYQEGWFGLPVDKKRSHYWQERIKTSSL